MVFSFFKNIIYILIPSNYHYDLENTENFYNEEYYNFFENLKIDNHKKNISFSTSPWWINYIYLVLLKFMKESHCPFFLE